MLSNQGDSLGFVTLKQGFVGVVAASPTVDIIKNGITTMQCTVSGTATVVWKDGTTKTPVTFVAGQYNSIERNSMATLEVLTGAFNFGSD